MIRRISVLMAAALSAAAVAQTPQEHDGRHYLPDALVDALDFYEEDGAAIGGRVWYARSLCTSARHGAEDTLEAELRYAACVRDTAYLVWDTLGHTHVPDAEEVAGLIPDGLSGIVGARIFYPSQDAAIGGFTSIEFRADRNGWTLASDGLSVLPRRSTEGELVVADCRTERTLSDFEAGMLSGHVVQIFNASPLAAAPAGLCLDGGPTLTEIFVLSGGETPSIKREAYLRECGTSDGITSFNYHLMRLLGERPWVAYCVWPDAIDDDEILVSPGELSARRATDKKQTSKEQDTP